MNNSIPGRIMRSERRGLLKRMYPNPFIRLVRNGVVLGWNIIKAATRLAAKAIKRITKEASPPNKITPITKPGIKEKRRTKRPAQIPAIRRSLVRSRVSMPANYRMRRI